MRDRQFLARPTPGGRPARREQRARRKHPVLRTSRVSFCALPPCLKSVSAVRSQTLSRVLAHRSASARAMRCRVHSSASIDQRKAPNPHTVRLTAGCPHRAPRAIPDQSGSLSGGWTRRPLRFRVGHYRRSEEGFEWLEKRCLLVGGRLCAVASSWRYRCFRRPLPSTRNCRKTAALQALTQPCLLHTAETSPAFCLCTANNPLWTPSARARSSYVSSVVPERSSTTSESCRHIPVMRLGR